MEQVMRWYEAIEARFFFSLSRKIAANMLLLMAVPIAMAGLAWQGGQSALAALSIAGLHARTSFRRALASAACGAA